MRFDYYVEETRNLRASNRLLKFAITAIALAVAVQGFFTYAALKHQKVVLVPAGLSEKVWIGGGEASDEYLKIMGRYLSLLLLHYTPSSAGAQFSEFLSYVSPEAYPSLRAELEENLHRIEMLNITSVFHVQEMELDRTKREILVKGFLRQYAGEAEARDEHVVCLIRYRIGDGRLMVDEVEQKTASGS